MNVFDIIGPVMIGPSSSHTAGACRIGRYARILLGEEPNIVDIYLSGSFKNTYKGHGTDKAIIVGLLGYNIDDINIKNSIEIAKSLNKSFNIVEKDIELSLPNTIMILMKRKNNKIVTIQGCSVGGGNILINKINNVSVNITGVFDVLIVNHLDVPGMIYKITKVLNDKKINTNSLSLERTEKNKDAVVIIELDDKVSNDVIKSIASIDNVNDVTLLPALEY